MKFLILLQINAVTSYIDGSAIYGSYDGKSSCLRSKKRNGQLAMAKDGFEFLPHRAESCEFYIKIKFKPGIYKTFDS